MWMEPYRCICSASLNIAISSAQKGLLLHVHLQWELRNIRISTYLFQRSWLYQNILHVDIVKTIKQNIIQSTFKIAPRHARVHRFCAPVRDDTVIWNCIMETRNRTWMRAYAHAHTLETVHTIIMRVPCVCACASHYKSYAENKWAHTTLHFFLVHFYLASPAGTFQSLHIQTIHHACTPII